MASITKRDFPRLTRVSGRQWTDNMSAYLRSLGLWRIVTGTEVAPTPHNPNVPTRDEQNDLRAYYTRVDKASGEIFMAVEPLLQSEIKSLQDSPKAMWDKLQELFNQKVPGARFNAYNKLLSVHLKDEDALSVAAFVSEVDSTMQQIKELRPADYGVEQLDSELPCMIVLRALRDASNPKLISIATSFLLDERLEYEKVKSVLGRDFTMEDVDSGSSSVISEASAAYAGPCSFCGGSHSIFDCNQMKAARPRSYQQPPYRGNRGGRGRGRHYNASQKQLVSYYHHPSIASMPKHSRTQR
ncbi:hypothetical protein FISHEDRAFT_38547 [Fistulina hepatica ATCC 64428]|nr:hypothetical protein FISHEDRAFT_38547 [Fistulina hepatica ATCC 64428]